MRIARRLFKSSTERSKRSQGPVAKNIREGDLFGGNVYKSLGSKQRLFPF